ncbi:hypothetical protein MYX65_11320 [Acidobacteria bacterium AH-259-L09]|nr:hypothetical protein [Acidobacteria bacterium AH-259-L09]
MDWADDVAYSVHDLEDGLLSGFLYPSMFSEERVIDRVHKNIEEAPVITKPTKQTIQEVLKELRDRLQSSKAEPSKSTIREVTRHYINRFVTTVDIKAEDQIKTCFNYELVVPQQVRETCAVLKALTIEFIVNDERTTTFAFKGEEIIRRIFEALRKNAHPDTHRRSRFKLFPTNMRDHLEAAQDDQTKLARLMCDYIASMTEGQAIRLHRRLFEPTGGSPFEPV